LTGDTCDPARDGDGELLPIALATLCDDIAAGAPGHGAGVGAAAVVSTAAAVVALVARASRVGWDDAGGVAAHPMALGRRARALAVADAGAFAVASAALRDRGAASASGVGAGGLGPALWRAADVPLAIVGTAAAVAELAAVVAAHGEPDRRPDAAAAAAMAAGAARAAAVLVEINLTVTAGDARREQARRELAAAVAACDTAAARVAA
jgi:formiminotetrahydrofolate cyclodeaminase